MTKVKQWHRRHAVLVAAQLPDNTEDGLIILRLATGLVNSFLAEQSLVGVRRSERREPCYTASQPQRAFFAERRKLRCSKTLMRFERS